MAIILFNNDVTNIVFQPLERIIKEVNKIATNPLTARSSDGLLSSKKTITNQNELKKPSSEFEIQIIENTMKKTG